MSLNSDYFDIAHLVKFWPPLLSLILFRQFTGFFVSILFISNSTVLYRNNIVCIGHNILLVNDHYVKI